MKLGCLYLYAFAKYSEPEKNSKELIIVIDITILNNLGNLCIEITTMNTTVFVSL
jgi:hypothetical protein